MFCRVLLMALTQPGCGGHCQLGQETERLLIWNVTGLAITAHRFPPEIISLCRLVYHRFCLGFRDVEDLLAERESSSLMRRFESGVRNSVLVMPETDAAAGCRSSAISGTLPMRASWTPISESFRAYPIRMKPNAAGASPNAGL